MVGRVGMGAHMALCCDLWHLFCVFIFGALNHSHVMGDNTRSHTLSLPLSSSDAFEISSPRFVTYLSGTSYILASQSIISGSAKYHMLLVLLLWLDDFVVGYILAVNVVAAVDVDFASLRCLCFLFAAALRHSVEISIFFR